MTKISYILLTSLERPGANLEQFYMYFKDTVWMYNDRQLYTISWNLWITSYFLSIEYKPYQDNI